MDRTKKGEKVFKNSTGEIRRHQSVPNKAKHCLQAFSAERCKSQLKCSGNGNSQKSKNVSIC